MNDGANFIIFIFYINFICLVFVKYIFVLCVAFGFVAKLIGFWEFASVITRLTNCGANPSKQPTCDSSIF